MVTCKIWTFIIYIGFTFVNWTEYIILSDQIYLYTFFINFRPAYLVSIGNEILVERNKMLVPAQVIDVFDLKLQGKQYLSYGKSKTFIEVLSEWCTGHMVACLLTMPLHGFVVFFLFLNEHNLVKTASPYGHLVAWVLVVLMFINEPVEWCYSPTFDFLQWKGTSIVLSWKGTIILIILSCNCCL